MGYGPQGGKEVNSTEATQHTGMHSAEGGARARGRERRVQESPQRTAARADDRAGGRGYSLSFPHPPVASEPWGFRVSQLNQPSSGLEGVADMKEAQYRDQREI